MERSLRARLLSAAVAARWIGWFRKEDDCDDEQVFGFKNGVFGGLRFGTDLRMRDGRDGVYRFKETITSGRATDTSGGCIDGQITMIRQGAIVEWQWSGSWKGKGYSASGTFYRR